MAVEGASIDREAGVIRGASAMQAVEALGHEVMVDAKTLERIASLGNAAKSGVKVRFTHPGMCSDGLGRMLGRMKDFRVAGDKVVGDIYLSESASHTPEGDLRAYVLDLAEEDPSSFGMSVVVAGGSAWKLADGTEVETRERPKNAAGKLPFLRPTKLYAADVVDEPAANRDGLFSAAFDGTSNDAAAEAFGLLDHMRERFGLTLAKANEFAARYFVARGLTKTDETAGDAPAQDPKGEQMDKETLKALRQANPGHDLLILDMFADGKTEAEIVKAIETERTAALAKAADELKKKLGEAEALAAVQTEQIKKLEAERDEAKAALAKLDAVAAAPKDPGQDAGPVDKPKPIECTSEELAAGKYSTADILSGRVVLKSLTNSTPV
jgi:hypothetical protein